MALNFEHIANGVKERLREGESRAVILRDLENMREGLSEPDEDRLLEIMDIASGFCSKPSQDWLAR